MWHIQKNLQSVLKAGNGQRSRVSLMHKIQLKMEQACKVLDAEAVGHFLILKRYLMEITYSWNVARQKKRSED